ncbi:hypothetical protein HanPI659440_Chr03g0095491 [Helianthus annuus]|nr:hypothetical protein HanPI659440_Chr03g0095491 [Helianthus annuus]
MLHTDRDLTDDFVFTRIQLSSSFSLISLITHTSHKTMAIYHQTRFMSQICEDSTAYPLLVTLPQSRLLLHSTYHTSPHFSTNPNLLLPQKS